MEFNNGLERKRLEERWEKLRKEYAAAGMDEAGIQKMYEYDLAQYKRERVFCFHNQYYPEVLFESDACPEDKSTLLDRYLDKLSVYMPDNPDESRYGWIQDIENEKLFHYLHNLPMESLELITMLTEGLSQKDIAKVMGISEQAVSKRIKVLRKNIKTLL